MPRPPKLRCMAHSPDLGMFRPAGIPAWDQVHVEPHLDEIEALRLVDGHGLIQVSP